MLSCSASHQSRDASVVCLDFYRAQKRKAAATAKAYARRRAVTALVLLLLGLAFSSYVQQREQQIQQIEQRHQ